MQRCLVILSQQDQAEVLLNMAAQFLARVNGNRMDVLAAREPPTQVLGNMGLTDESAAVLRENQREWPIACTQFSIAGWRRNMVLAQSG